MARSCPLQPPERFDDPPTSVLREGARRLLAQVVEARAQAFLEAMREERLRDPGRPARPRAGADHPGRHRSGPGEAGRAVRSRCRGCGDAPPSPPGSRGGQRPRHGAVGPADDEGRPRRDPGRAEPGSRRSRRRPHRDGRGQVPQGDPMPDEGRRRAPRRLRHPGRASGSLADDGPDRERPRDRAASDRAQEGCPVPPGTLRWMAARCVPVTRPPAGAARCSVLCGRSPGHVASVAVRGMATRYRYVAPGSRPSGCGRPGAAACVCCGRGRSADGCPKRGPRCAAASRRPSGAARASAGGCPGAAALACGARGRSLDGCPMRGRPGAVGRVGTDPAAHEATRARLPDRSARTHRRPAAGGSDDAAGWSKT